MSILLSSPAPNRSLHNITHIPLHNPLPPIWSSHNRLFIESVQPQRFCMFQNWQPFPCPSRTFLIKTAQPFLCKLDTKCLACTVSAQEKFRPAKRQWCPFFKEGSALQKGPETVRYKIRTMIQKHMGHCTVIRKRSQLCPADRLKRRGREQLREAEGEEEEGEGRQRSGVKKKGVDRKEIGVEERGEGGKIIMNKAKKREGRRELALTFLPRSPTFFYIHLQ